MIFIIDYKEFFLYMIDGSFMVMKVIVIKGIVIILVIFFIVFIYF